MPGADSTGLSDPFVQIIIENYCLKTKVTISLKMKYQLKKSL